MKVATSTHDPAVETSIAFIVFIPLDQAPSVLPPGPPAPIVPSVSANADTVDAEPTGEKKPKTRK